MMGTVQISNIGYLQSRGTLGQISALRGVKSLYGTLLDFYQTQFFGVILIVRLQINGTNQFLEKF